MKLRIPLAFLLIWTMVNLMTTSSTAVTPIPAPRGKTDVFVNRSLVERAAVANLRFDTRLGGFRLQDDPAGGFVEIGSVTSDIVFYESGVTSIVPSWNADCPDGTFVRIELQARPDAESEWSSWYQIANWGDPDIAETRNPETVVKGDAFAKVVEDILELSRPCTQLRYRVTLVSTDKASSPLLTLVALAAINKDLLNAPDDSRGPAWGRSVKCDFISQVVQPRDLAWRVCGPTSLTMALTAHGVSLKVPFVSDRSWDAVNSIYGNWPFLAAAGSDLLRRYENAIPQKKGFRKAFQAYVMWPSDWKAVEREILSGNPCILSMRFERGELSVDPDRRSDGHLIVVRGFTKNGDVMCLDPAYRDEKNGRITYNRQELHNARHGGPIIVLHPYSKY